MIHLMHLTQQHEAICAFPSKEFYNDELKTDQSVVKRRDRSLEKFWPRGNQLPIMFVDVVGTEGQDMGSNKSETKVGVESKYNMEEVQLMVGSVIHIYCKRVMPKISILRLQLSNHFIMTIALLSKN